MPFEKGRHIKRIEYLPPEPQIPSLKNSIVDVKCKDNEDRQFIIEMQMYWTDSFKSRVLFNASKAYVWQLEMGRRYKTLQPVYALNFVNELYSGTSNFYHHYSIRNVKDNADCLGGLEFVFIELPNFDPVGLDKDMLVLWLRFLTEIKHDCERISEDLLEDSHIRRASEILEYG